MIWWLRASDSGSLIEQIFVPRFLAILSSINEILHCKNVEPANFGCL
jgi:hypothetical protein